MELINREVYKFILQPTKAKCQLELRACASGGASWWGEEHRAPGGFRAFARATAGQAGRFLHSLVLVDTVGCALFGLFQAAVGPAD